MKAKDPEQSISGQLLDLYDNLTAVSDLLVAMDGPHAVDQKQVNAMARLLGIVEEQLEAAKAELDAIRHAA
jgi:hypothetical protein